MRTIRPLRDIEHVSPAAAMRDADYNDAPRHVFDTIDMAVVVSSEMMWPTLLKLARDLRGKTIEIDGWRLRAEPSRRQLDTLFVLEEIGGNGGYLFNLRLRPRRTEAAMSMLDDVSLGVEAEIAALKNAEARLKRRYDSIMNPSKEAAAIDADPTSYLPDDQCHDVEHFSCAAFTTNGVAPEGYDREGYTPHTLEAAARIGPDATNDMPGMIFAFQPSWLIAMGDDPEVPVLRTIADGGASFGVLKRLSSMLQVIGLSSEVATRNEKLGGIAYTHYGIRSNSDIMELAASAVHRDGGLVGQATTRAISRAFGIACDRIVDEYSTSITTAIQLMLARGHVDKDSAYDGCGDAIHVRETGEAEGVMSVRTSHDCYRLDYVLDEDGLARRFYLCIVDAPDAQVPVPGEPGFLGCFTLSTDGRVIERTINADGFQDGAMRSLNDLTLSVSLAEEKMQQPTRPRIAR